MKKYLLIFLLGLCTLLSGCRNELLDQKPQDKITDEQFFKTANDLYIYSVKWYTWFFTVYADWNKGPLDLDITSDIMVGQHLSSYLNGTDAIPVQSGWGNWDWSQLRDINYFLEYYTNCEESLESYKNYLGDAYFFRAIFYFKKVQKYGDVPWIDRVLDQDSPELFGGREKRTVIVNHIMSDLDSAYKYLDLKADRGNHFLSREAVLLYKTRVGLYEGTWQKYHEGTPFATQGADYKEFLRMAVEAGNELINTGLGPVSGPEIEEPYKSFFNQYEYSNSNDVLLWKEYSMGQGMYHFAYSYFSSQQAGFGITKNLATQYLCADGLPTALSDLDFENPITLEEEAQGRDPRFRETILVPGTFWEYLMSGEELYFTRPRLDETDERNCPTGYQQRKFCNVNFLLDTQFGPSDYPCLIMRATEGLLNYAEAKAELGELTTSDLQSTINKIRSRVGMPDMPLNPPVDPNGLKYYASKSISTQLMEIRRERMVELVGEGHRTEDIKRWAAHNLITGQRPKGYKSAELDFADLPDLVATFKINSDGRIDQFMDILPNGFGFRPQQDYLKPIPQNELVLNPNLTQNPGW